MAFQRSYSKVWWGSDNQLTTSSSTLGNGSGSAGYYSYFNQAQPQQHQYQQQQQQQHQYQQSLSGYHSLDLNHFRGYGGNLSRIQEVDDEQNNSRLSAASATAWEKHDSPGSLRSQDSGFSDNDESHSMRSLGGRSSKTASPSTRSVRSTQSAESPASADSESVATPPTVIRRVRKPDFYSPIVSVSRRISFTGPSTAKLDDDASQSYSHNNTNGSDDQSGALLTQLDEMSLLNSSSGSSNNNNNNNNSSGQVKVGGGEAAVKLTKRRRRVMRRPTKPLTPTKRRTSAAEQELSDDDDSVELELKAVMTSDGGHSGHSEHTPRAYNNETVYLGLEGSSTPPPPYNNETVLLGGVDSSGGSNSSSASSVMTSPALHGGYTAQTSTPKRASENPLLHAHPAALQTWLGALRTSYEHEVMSTLQTKSIAQQAIQSLTITTNTVTKLIRQLQQRAICLQAEFERIERLLVGNGNVASGVGAGAGMGGALQLALASTEQLLGHVDEFVLVLQRRAMFFAESRAERRRYDDCLEEIRSIAKDTRYSLERHHYISAESLLDDVQVMKRHLLFALRQVFERMVHVIVQRIEAGRCDLMLRANINMIATLSNIDYEGFASLTDAFVQCETVRALLIVCLEHGSSAVRAQALRALATVCCAPEAIAQLGACGGIEILRDILQVPQPTQAASSPVAATAAAAAASNSTGSLRRRRNKRVEAGATERREAVSLLTQITAAWHGAEHRVDGLRDCVEPVVEGLTHMIVQTRCAQTLLLCAAALNNLSRIEVTSHYSIMSNEAIFRLVETAEQKEDDITIFFYEQVVAMLHNMSLNKKCHSHLANGSIINFITSSYQAQFYKVYESRAESESQRRTVKAILHTLTRLVHDSNLGVDLLAQQRGVPAFLRLANSSCSSSSSGTAGGIADLSQLHAEISLLARDLLYAQRSDNRNSNDNDHDDNSERRLQHDDSYNSCRSSNSSNSSRSRRSSSNSNDNGSRGGSINEAPIDCGNVVAGDTITSATGLKLNLARQESYV